MTIGIFDSGIGGLGIFDEIRKLMPNEQILYLADTTNCPYGEKSEEEIKRICLNNGKFLIDHGADIIVVACNTGSTVALNYLREHLRGGGDSSEVGSVIPVVGVVPVVKTCSEVSKNKRIGILATTRTVESQYLKNLVEKFCPSTPRLRGINPAKDGFKVYYQAANPIVELVENDSTNSKFQFEICNPLAMTWHCRAGQTQNSSFKTLKHLNFNKNLLSSRARVEGKLKIKNYQLLQKFLQPFIDAKVDVIALGCTHFPFFRQQIEQIMGGKVRILDSNGAVARQVARIVTCNKVTSDEGKPTYQFFTTGNPEILKKQIRNLINLKITNVDKVAVG